MQFWLLQGLTFWVNSCMICVTCMKMSVIFMGNAPVAKLVYAVDLGSASLWNRGSSPLRRTTPEQSPLCSGNFYKNRHLFHSFFCSCKSDNSGTVDLPGVIRPPGRMYSSFYYYFDRLSGVKLSAVLSWASIVILVTT